MNTKTREALELAKSFITHVYEQDGQGEHELEKINEAIEEEVSNDDEDMSNEDIALAAESVFEEHNDKSTAWCLQFTADICGCAYEDVVSALSEKHHQE